MADKTVHSPDEPGGKPSQKEVNAFTWAARAGIPHLVTEFLERHGDAADAKDGNGRTALLYAAANGHLDMALELLACGADPNESQTFTESETPFLAAIKYGFVPIAQAMLEYGADIRTVDQGKTSAEMISFLKDFEEKRLFAKEIADFSPHLKRPMRAPQKLGLKP